MAQLRSEDFDCPSTLSVTPGKAKEMSGQQWQPLVVQLISGSRPLSTLDNEECFVCRRPTDETAQLIRDLRQLTDHQEEEVLFEPAEPSFELNFTRTRRGGIKVEAWLDSGNGVTGIYTGDASGIRFHTTDELLKEFIDQLSAEFRSVD